MADEDWHFKEYGVTEEQMKDRSIDYDLFACLTFNPQPFKLIDIDKVLAVFEGEHDSKEGHWVIRLDDNRYLYLRGGCNYTGWDCNSWAFTLFLIKSKYLIDDFSKLDIQWRNDEVYIYDTLVQQLKNGKGKTWRDKKDEEFGLSSILDTIQIPTISN